MTPSAGASLRHLLSVVQEQGEEGEIPKGIAKLLSISLGEQRDLNLCCRLV